jgi:hypothetical protein
MEFKGTFKLKNLNKEAGKGISTKFRTRVKIIYLTACAAYLGAVARATPVLTGASRTALIWRMKELLDAAVAIDAKIAAELGVMSSIRSIPMTMTNAKYKPQQVPSPFVKEPSLPGVAEEKSGREEWRDDLLEEGQTTQSWMSNAYVPLIIDVGVGKTYSGKYRVFFEIKDFYLEHYDAGTIESSEWVFKLKDEEGNIIGNDTYNVPPWNLHLDGRKAFREMFSRLMKRSGFNPKEYTKMIATVGTISEEQLPEAPF